jgi:hypothetical protein
MMPSGQDAHVIIWTQLKPLEDFRKWLAHDEVRFWETLMIGKFRAVVDDSDAEAST